MLSQGQHPDYMKRFKTAKKASRDDLTTSITHKTPSKAEVFLGHVFKLAIVVSMLVIAWLLMLGLYKCGQLIRTKMETYWDIKLDGIQLILGTTAMATVLLMAIRPDWLAVIYDGLWGRQNPAQKKKTSSSSSGSSSSGSDSSSERSRKQLTFKSEMVNDPTLNKLTTPDSWAPEAKIPAFQTATCPPPPSSLQSGDEAPRNLNAGDTRQASMSSLLQRIGNSNIDRGTQTPADGNDCMLLEAARNEGPGANEVFADNFLPGGQQAGSMRENRSLQEQPLRSHQQPRQTAESGTQTTDEDRERPSGSGGSQTSAGSRISRGEGGSFRGITLKIDYPRIGEEIRISKIAVTRSSNAS